MKLRRIKEYLDQENIKYAIITHSQLIQMAYHDFERLVHPRTLEFARALA